MDLLDKILRAQEELSRLEHQHWLDSVVFTFNWWFLLFLLIVPWFIWWKLKDSKRVKEILLYGSYVIIVSTTFDDIGIVMTFWIYPYQLVQVMDRLNSIDLTMLPILYMLIYQYFPKWKHFLLASAVMSFIFAFIFEPFFVWIGIYKTITWKYIYSLPIYFIIAVTGKLFIMKLNKVSKK